jgi:hypothetical protein
MLPSFSSPAIRRRRIGYAGSVALRPTLSSGMLLRAIFVLYGEFQIRLNVKAKFRHHCALA